MIIDLCRYKDVVVDPSQHTVSIRGGVLMKELQIALSEKNQFTSKCDLEVCYNPLITFQLWRMVIPSVRFHT